MSEYFIQFDKNNNLFTRFDSDPSYLPHPAGTVEVSEDLFWQTISERDGIWKRDPSTGEISKHPFPPQTDEQLSALAKIQRDNLLKESDWVGLRSNESGQPIPKEWLKYRQDLRDITKQSGFPKTIEWPTIPTT